MADQLQYALDRIALMDVMIKYGTAVDARDLDRYATCFADDVVVGGYGAAEYRGRQAYVDYVREALKRFAVTQHLMGNQKIVSLEGNRAVVETDVQATHILAENEKTVMTLWAYYRDEMERIGGEWKIKRHELHRRSSQVVTAD